MVFDRTRQFTLPFEVEESFTYTFNNIVTESGNRNERRILRRTQFRANVGFSQITFKCGEDRDFIDFYQASLGTTNSFLYKSNVDYKTTGVPATRKFDNEYFTYTQGIAYRVDAFADEWTMYKKYAIATGSLDSPVDQVASYKRLYEIDPSTIQFYQGGVENNNQFTYDPVTGLATIPTGVNGNQDLTFDCEFSLRVRFGDNSQDTPLSLNKISQDNIYTLSNLSLIEVILDTQVDFQVFNADDFRETTEARLDLPLEPSNSRVLSLPTFSQNLDSGKETRFPNSDELYIDETFAAQSLYQDEAFYLRDFFVACKGRITGFQYQLDEGLRFCRFDQDAVSMTKVTHEDEIYGCKTIYNFNNVDLAQIDRQLVEVIGTDIDVYGAFNVFEGATARIVESIYADIRYYVNNTSHAVEGATGRTFLAPNFSSTVRFLARFNSIRITAESGKNIVALIFASRSTAYHSTVAGDTSGEPTSLWINDIASLRSNLLPGDKYTIIGVRSINPGSNAASEDNFNNLLERAFNGLAPYDVPGSPEYIKDLVDDGTLCYISGNVFDNQSTDISPILPFVFGGSLEVDYSGVDNSLEVFRVRGTGGQNSNDLNNSGDYLTNIEALMNLNVFNQFGATGLVRSVSFASGSRYLRAFNTTAGGRAGNQAVAYTTGGDDDYYIDNTITGQPTALWTTDALDFKSSSQLTDHLVVTQFIPAGSENDDLYLGFASQINGAINGSIPYDNPASDESIASRAEIITTNIADNSLSALPFVEALGAVVPIPSVEQGTDPILVAAFCLRIETPEGTVGLTSFDSNLTIGGQEYLSNFSIDSFAGSSEINLSIDNGEITQLIDGFQPWTVEQISAGYLNGNRIELRLFNPLSLPDNFDEGTPVISGTTGQVEIIDGSYKFEVRSISELANRPINHKTSPKCIYDFGDGRCKLDLVALGFEFRGATILTASDAFGQLITIDESISGSFINGTVTALTGENAGLVFNILDVNVIGVNAIRLGSEFAGNFQAGDLIDIKAYCAKDQTACQFYNNFINFGNVPVGGNYVPGLTRIAVIPDV